MQSKLEHFAATSPMGSQESSLRDNEELKFAGDREGTAFSMALALAKEGHYEYEDFRQELIAAIAEWEDEYFVEDKSWDYYQRWLLALERLAMEVDLVDEAQLEQHAAELN